VHPHLLAVATGAAVMPPIEFTVLEGMRTQARQAELYASGASQTMNSRHLTGHAVDLAPLIEGEVSWDWPHYHTLEPHIKALAGALGVAVTWGGDWTSFKDGPHWELSWDAYPGDTVAV
jgi:peptidoglycan L-alanyl-D-glutamate endopeptidase CwlK